jgi:hypothetical protein
MSGHAGCRRPSVRALVLDEVGADGPLRRPPARRVAREHRDIGAGSGIARGDLAGGEVARASPTAAGFIPNTELAGRI